MTTYAMTFDAFLENQSVSLQRGDNKLINTHDRLCELQNLFLSALKNIFFLLKKKSEMNGSQFSGHLRRLSARVGSVSP